MLTREEIKEKLQADPNYILPDDASEKEWDLYDEVVDELWEDGDDDDGNNDDVNSSNHQE